MSRATLQRQASPSPHERSGSASVALPFAAIVLAMLPAVLDQTILATALPVVAADLGRITDVSWVVTAYVVAAAATTPLWGKLGDRHGRKLLLEVALLVFVLTSALCGAAQDITQLVVLRAVQGAAAGGLMTLAMATVGDLVAPRERGRYQGYIAATFAAATIVGPLIGGVLVDHASWRWVFLVNLPIGAAALAGLHLRLPAPQAAGADRPLDAPGAVLLAGATTALMLTCIWGGSRYAWDSARGPRPDRRGRRPVRRPARPRAPRGRPDRPVPPAAQRALSPSPAPRCSSRPPRCSRSPSSSRSSWRRRPARARPRPACSSCRPCSASPSRPRSPAARSRAPGATSASRSRAWP